MKASRCPGIVQMMMASKKKILYALRSKYHFHYFSTTIRRLCEEGHDVTVVFDSAWSEGKDDKAAEAAQKQYPNLAYGTLIRRKGPLRPFVFLLREILNYARYLRPEGQSVFYRDRWGGYLPALVRPIIQSAPARFVLSFRRFQDFLAACQRAVPTDPAIRRWLAEFHPDVLVVSPGNMRYAEEIEYLKAGADLGIPTVVQTISWDNLTTKGLFHSMPDVFLVWNKTQQGEAVRFHDVPLEQVVITGAPVFDQWFKARETAMSRKGFLEKVGLDPENPFVVYLGSSTNIAKDESWLVQELSSALERLGGKDGRKISILIRPHPANAAIYKSLKDPRIAVWPREGRLPDTEDGFMDFFDTMHYCVCSVGLNTTGMIDAVIADKAVISVSPPQYDKTQMMALHFRHLIEADVLVFAKTAEEAAGQCLEVLAGRDEKGPQRNRFIADFIRPRGRSSSSCELAARVIVETANGIAPAAISAGLPGIF